MAMNEVHMILNDTYKPEDGPRCTAKELWERMAEAIWGETVERGFAVQSKR